MHDCFTTYLHQILQVLLQNDEVDKLEVFLGLKDSPGIDETRSATSFIQRVATLLVLCNDKTKQPTGGHAAVLQSDLSLPSQTSASTADKCFILLKFLLRSDERLDKRYVSKGIYWQA